MAIARLLLPAGVELLDDRFEVVSAGLEAGPEEVRGLARGASAIVADPTVLVDAPLLDAAGPGLKVVANFAVGHDHVDLEACRARGVAVTNTPDVLTNATAELALALALAAARHLPSTERLLRSGDWEGWDPGAHRGHELSGSTVGVVGRGRLGCRFAELLGGFGVDLLYCSPTAKEEAARAVGAERVDLDQLLRRSDLVSLHAPANDSTHHMIDAGAIELMKASAVLVNTSRGGLVDLAAVAAALRDDRLGAAGLDVFEGEPDIPAEILEAPRTALTPHIGSATFRARDGMARAVAKNVIAVLDGREPPNLVA
ncbi:MAG: NAD(P)-dependent oxidoreductase [Solirubrobacterales bacterium]